MINIKKLYYCDTGGGEFNNIDVDNVLNTLSSFGSIDNNWEKCTTMCNEVFNNTNTTNQTVKPKEIIGANFYLTNNNDIFTVNKALTNELTDLYTVLNNIKLANNQAAEYTPPTIVSDSTKQTTPNTPDTPKKPNNTTITKPYTKPSNEDTTTPIITPGVSGIVADIPNNPEIPTNEETTVTGTFAYDGKTPLYDEFGNPIDLSKGNYEIIDIKYDKNGNIIAICIKKDGKEIWAYFKNPNSLVNAIALTVIGSLVYDGINKLLDANGNPLDLAPGKYDIADIKYDKYGNIIAILINVNGEYMWITFPNGNGSNSVMLDGQKAIFNFVYGKLNIYDENGNIIGSLSQGKYRVYEVKYDKNGNIIAIRISKDGEPEQWIYMKDFTSNTQALLIDNSYKGTYILMDGMLPIVDENGNIINNAHPGNYKVYEIKYDKFGNIIAIRISKDGEPEQWISFKNQNGTYSGTFISNEQFGVYTFNEGTLNIYDANGNIIGILNPGSYNVYDIKVDEFGNVIAIRISKDGEPEQWINISFNGLMYGTYTPIKQVLTVDNDKGLIALFQSKNAKLGGIIGILLVALGATLLIKHKKKKKEEAISEGEYDIYETKYSEDGSLTAARISNDDSDDELWVEF